jgi:hypothetical protein
VASSQREAKTAVSASEAQALGYGGISKVSEICGLSRATVTKGLKELGEEPLECSRIRMPGSGRPTLISSDPTLILDLENILESATRGDPESPLLWTCLSTRAIADCIMYDGHSVGYR